MKQPGQSKETKIIAAEYCLGEGDESAVYLGWRGSVPAQTRARLCTVSLLKKATVDDVDAFRCVDSIHDRIARSFSPGLFVPVSSFLQPGQDGADELVSCMSDAHGGQQEDIMVAGVALVWAPCSHALDTCGSNTLKSNLGALLPLLLVPRS